MKSQPLYHPSSNPRDRRVAFLQFAVLAAANSVIPLSSVATNRVAAAALHDYQMHAIDRDALAREIAERNPNSTLWVLQAAAARQSACLAHALGHEMGHKGWYSRNARRMAANLIIWVIALRVILADGSILNILTGGLHNV